MRLLLIITTCISLASATVVCHNGRISAEFGVESVRCKSQKTKTSSLFCTKRGLERVQNYNTRKGLGPCDTIFRNHPNLNLQKLPSLTVLISRMFLVPIGAGQNGAAFKACPDQQCTMTKYVIKRPTFFEMLQREHDNQFYVENFDSFTRKSLDEDVAKFLREIELNMLIQKRAIQDGDSFPLPRVMGYTFARRSKNFVKHYDASLSVFAMDETRRIESMYMVMEPMSRYSLKDLYADASTQDYRFNRDVFDAVYPGLNPAEKPAAILMDILRGLQTIHKVSVHMDLTSNNVMFDTDLHARIIDIGENEMGNTPFWYDDYAAIDRTWPTGKLSVLKTQMDIRLIDLNTFGSILSELIFGSRAGSPDVRNGQSQAWKDIRNMLWHANVDGRSVEDITTDVLARLDAAPYPVVK